MNQLGGIIPVNFNIQFKAFLQKNDFGVICIPFPDAPVAYEHCDGTIWMKTERFGATWPFESVIAGLPEFQYEGRAYV